MPSADKPQPLKMTNVWLTAKARMEAEKRLKLYDVVSHLVLIWYSLWLLCLTVFSKSFEPFVGAIGIGELATFLSASVLVLSVTTWGFKFGTKAALHRDCYLELERLLANSSADKDSDTEYAEIKKRYPNHSTYDLDAVFFRRILIRGEEIENSRGKVTFGFLAGFLYCITWVAEKLILLFAFALPVAVAVLLYAF